MSNDSLEYSSNVTDQVSQAEGINPFGFWESILTSIPLDTPAGLAMVVIALLVLTVLITLLLYGLYIRKKAKGSEGYEKTPILNFIRSDAERTLESMGASTSETLRYNLREIGTVYRIAEFSEFDDVESYLEALSEENDHISFDNQSFEDLNDHIDVEDLVKEGLIDSAQADEIKSEGFISHRLLAVRPSSTLGWFRWIIYDRIYSNYDYTTYFMVPEILLKDNGNAIQIPRNIQFRNFGGIEMPLYRSSMAVMFSMVQRQGMEMALEDLLNYSEKMIYSDPDYVQTIEELAKRYQLEKESKSGSVAGDVNSG